MSKEVGFHDFPTYEKFLKWHGELGRLSVLNDESHKKYDYSIEGTAERAKVYHDYITKLYEPWELLNQLRPSNSSFMYREVEASTEVCKRAYAQMKAEQQDQHVAINPELPVRAAPERMEIE